MNRCGVGFLVSVVVSVCSCGGEYIVPVNSVSEPTDVCTGQESLMAMGELSRVLSAGGSTSLVVSLNDSCTGPVSGAGIEFAAAGIMNGSSLSGNASVTGSDGSATVTVYAGAQTAEFEVSAIGPADGSDVVFTIQVAVDPCADHCGNGIKDCGEDGPDCGGTCGVCPPWECGQLTLKIDPVDCGIQAATSANLDVSSQAISLQVDWNVDDYANLTVGSWSLDEPVQWNHSGHKELTIAEIGGPGTKTAGITAFNAPASQGNHCPDERGIPVLTWLSGTMSVTVICQ